MRITKRTIAFVLIAVLLLALLPTTAFADPPQNDPSHRHKWKVVSETKPTCTEDGKKTWKCSACGKKYSEKIPALGHDWDEGVITTEPLYFTPGERTYTCKHDSSHTRTESVEATAQDIFAHLHGYSWSWMPVNIDPLIITEQPEGGAITRYGDDTHMLHVAAIGGKGAYTYEWVSRSITSSSWLPAAWSWATLQTSGELTEPDYEVNKGGRRYWCIITDETDHTVSSNPVDVNFKISIGKQPDNVNLQSKDPTLSCEAIDGSGDYTYRWYNTDLVFQGKGASLPIKEEGDYFCTVEDNVTGETVDSEPCTVYSVKPLKVYSHTPNAFVWPEEEVKFRIRVEGGVEPYEVWAKRDGELIPVEEYGRDSDGRQLYIADAAEAGTYTFYVVDDLYANTTCKIDRFNKELTVKKQPVGKTFPENGKSDLSITMLDGTAPFTFILYRNGTECERVQRNSYSGYFNIWFAGDYYVHVIDAKGHSVDSKHAVYDNEMFQIRSQTEKATITKPYSAAKLEVEAVKGVEPYSYEWSFYGYNETEGCYTWYKTGGNDPYCYAYYPGRYHCLVKDYQGRKLWTKEIPVEYISNAPFIIKQPRDMTVKKHADGTYEFTISCRAICGSPNGTPRYEWYWRAWEGNGQWYHMTTSYKNEYKANRPGMYACKVYDDSTGQFTWTSTAVVSEKLVNTLSEAWKSSNAKYYFYRFSFTGGVGPYEVKVYLYNAENENEYLYLYKTSEVFYMNDLNEMKMLLPKYMTLQNVKKGEWEYARVGIIVVVTDYLGHKCESSRVCWK